MHESLGDFEALRAFVHTARSGGFAAAARVLGKDSSVINRRVASLEERSGVRLFERTTRRMKLTVAGAAFLERVEAILEELEAAHAELNAGAHVAKGLIRVSLPQTFGRMYVLPLLPAFMAEFPGIAVDARLSDRYVDLIDEGFDVALRLGALPDSSLVARRVASYVHRVYASPAFLKRHGHPESPKDLERLPGIGYAGFRRPEVWELRKGATTTEVSVPLAFQVDDGLGMLVAAEAGLGHLLVAEWLVKQSVEQGRLVPVLPAWRGGTQRQVHVVTSTRRALPAKTHQFTRWLVSRMKAALTDYQLD